jgi:hypothetical protein
MGDRPEDLDARIAALERKRTVLVQAAAEVGPEAVVEVVRQVESDLAALRGRRERVVLAAQQQAEVRRRVAELPHAVRAWRTWTPADWRRFIIDNDVRVTVIEWDRPYPALRVEGLLALPGNPETVAGWRR